VTTAGGNTKESLTIPGLQNRFAGIKNTPNHRPHHQLFDKRKTTRVFYLVK